MTFAKSNIAMNAEADCKNVNGQVPVPENEQENNDYYAAFVTLFPKAKCGFIARVFHQKLVSLLNFITFMRGFWDNPYNRGNQYVFCDFRRSDYPKILLLTGFYLI